MGDVISITEQREREVALEDAALWSNRIELSRASYGAALDRCEELGISPTTIARRVGKSEAAIRLHLRRRKKK